MKDTLDVDIVHVYLGLSPAVDSAGAGPDWAGPRRRPGLCCALADLNTEHRASGQWSTGPPEYNAHVE